MEEGDLDEHGSIKMTLKKAMLIIAILALAVGYYYAGTPNKQESSTSSAPNKSTSGIVADTPQKTSPRPLIKVTNQPSALEISNAVLQAEVAARLRPAPLSQERKSVFDSFEKRIKSQMPKETALKSRETMLRKADVYSLISQLDYLEYNDLRGYTTANLHTLAYEDR